MKIFVSQPMSGQTNDEIEEVRDCAFKHIQEVDHDSMSSWAPYEKDLHFTKKDNGPLRGFAISTDIRSCCDAVYLCNGWRERCAWLMSRR